MNQSDTVKRSWNRAKALATLAEGNIEGLAASKPGKARSFLSKHGHQEIDGVQFQKICDWPKTDKRNPKVRKLLKAYQEYLLTATKTTTEPRPSKGDPTKPVRAGAPKPRKIGGKPCDPTQIAGDILIDLRAVQRKYNITTNDMAYCIQVLGDLIDSPLDTKEFLNKIKTAAKCRT